MNSHRKGYLHNIEEKLNKLRIKIICAVFDLFLLNRTLSDIFCSVIKIFTFFFTSEMINTQKYNDMQI